MSLEEPPTELADHCRGKLHDLEVEHQKALNEVEDLKRILDETQELLETGFTLECGAEAEELRSRLEDLVSHERDIGCEDIRQILMSVDDRDSCRFLDELQKALTKSQLLEEILAVCRQENECRPMGTAPRDGTHVLIHTKDGTRIRAKWLVRHSMWRWYLSDEIGDIFEEDALGWSPVPPNTTNEQLD